MLFVFICEEETRFRNLLSECVNEFIFANEPDMQLALCTDNTDEMISAIQSHRAKGVYFLSEENTQAADALGQYVNGGTVIHAAREADETVLRENIHDSLEKSYQAYIFNTPLFRFKTRGNRYMACAYDDILFFETDPINSRWIILHTKYKDYDLIGTLRYLSQVLLPDLFFRCHKSFLVNIGNIPESEFACIEKGMIVMKEDCVCHVSVRKGRELIKKLNNRQLRPVEKSVPFFSRINKKIVFQSCAGLFLISLCTALAFFIGVHSVTDRAETPSEATGRPTPSTSPEPTAAQEREPEAETDETPLFPDLWQVNIPMSSASITISSNEATHIILDITQSSVIIETHADENIKIQNTGENLPPYILNNNNLRVTAENAGVIIISIPENAETLFSITAVIENGDIQIAGNSAFAVDELIISVRFGSISLSSIFTLTRLDLQTHHGNIYLDNVSAPYNHFMYNANQGSIVTR